MAVESAGILAFRKHGGVYEVLLAHPGGPFWAKKDTWSIPKGELDEGEELLAAAQREFTEETGLPVPEGQLIELGAIKQSSAKTNHIWAVGGDPDIQAFTCNTFTLEWPPKSGQVQEFPENDRIAWFPLSEAVRKIFEAQVPFIERLAEELDVEISGPAEQQSLL